MNIERIKCGNANWFLLHGDDGAVLIDTSRPAYRERILAACRKTNVRLIVLT
jgi:glyoxylase-like metal-dependent hydrolase (beta-lactamase superfamily II)